MHKVVEKPKPKGKPEAHLTIEVGENYSQEALVKAGCKLDHRITSTLEVYHINGSKKLLFYDPKRKLAMKIMKNNTF